MSMSPSLLTSSLSYYLTVDSPAPRPEAWQLSLHTGAPGSNGFGNEVTDSTYLRQAVTFLIDTSDSEFPLASNDTLVEFPAAGEGFTATYLVAWDVTNGVPLVIQRLASDKVIGVGVQAQLAISELKIGGRT